jgi:hypothetical protein
MFLLIPLLFIWARAPMKYGIMSKTIILASFCFVVLLASADYQGTALIDSAKAADSWDEEVTEDENPRSDPLRPRLREGTRIASVVGKFSKVGRRWVFELEPVAETPEPTNEASSKREKSAKKNSVAEVDEPKDETAATKSQSTNLVRYRVLENLTLQRVVDAIGQDPNDVRWVISGTITEFDGENWLLLSTVFRAHSTGDSATSP